MHPVTLRRFSVCRQLFQQRLGLGVVLQFKITQRQPEPRQGHLGMGGMFLEKRFILLNRQAIELEVVQLVG